MKMKKFIAAVSAIVLGSALCVSLVGCGDEDKDNDSTTHQHTYGNWVVETEATCETDGLQKRECVDGDDVQTEVIPKLGHDYGDWDVTLPTRTEAGSAIKVCSHDASHTITVELPKLTANGAGYDSVQKNSDGTKTYSLKNDEGDISFSLYDIYSVSEAVNVGAATNSKAVSGEAEYYHRVTVWGDVESTSSISYELGNDYIHIVDNSMNTQGWYTYKEDGTFHAVLESYNVNGEAGITRDNVATEDILNGYGFGFVYLPESSSGAKAYGLGNFVQFMYNLALATENSALVEVMPDSQNSAYSFSFNCISMENTLMVSNVSFTFDDNYVIDSATLSIKNYLSANYTTDSNGNSTVNPGEEDSYASYEIYTVTQTSERAEGEELPTIPDEYKYENMIIGSFDLALSDGEILGDYLELDPVTPIVLTLTNIDPETYNSYFDPIKVYLRSEEGDEELQLTYGGTGDGHIIMYFNALDKNITLNSRVAGDFQLVFKTEKFEKVVDLHVNFADPASFGYNVYSYNEITGSTLWDNFTKEFTIYAGQSLSFRSNVLNPAFETAEFTATADGVELTDSWILGEAVKVFKTQNVGTYTITLTSAGESAKTASFTVNVVEAPDLSELLSGNYENTDDEKICVTFNPESEGATSGTAVIVVGEEGDTYTTTISYVYNAETGLFNVEVIDGVNDNKYNHNYGLVYTEQCNLFLTYTTEFGEEKRALLSRMIINNLVGQHIMSVGPEGAEELVVNQAGKYVITLPGKYMTFYKVNEGVLLLNSLDGGSTFLTTFTVVLELGDVLRVWYTNNNDYNFTYSIEYLGEVASVTGVTIDKEAAEVFVNGKLTLTANVLPSNAENTEVVWSSSDDSIATVNGGVVTGLKEGTVTITVTTVDGGYIATCVVTVKEAPNMNLAGNGSADNPYNIVETGTYYLFDVDYYSSTFYQFTVAEGEVYTLTTEDAEININTVIEFENGGFVIPDDSIDWQNLTAGTYYIEVMAASKDDTDISFTLTKKA